MCARTSPSGCASDDSSLTVISTGLEFCLHRVLHFRIRVRTGTEVGILHGPPRAFQKSATGTRAIPGRNTTCIPFLIPVLELVARADVLRLLLHLSQIIHHHCAPPHCARANSSIGAAFRDGGCSRIWDHVFFLHLAPVQPRRFLLSAHWSRQVSFGGSPSFDRIHLQCRGSGHRSHDRSLPDRSSFKPLHEPTEQDCYYRHFKFGLRVSARPSEDVRVP